MRQFHNSVTDTLLTSYFISKFELLQNNAGDSESLCQKVHHRADKKMKRAALQMEALFYQVFSSASLDLS